MLAREKDGGAGRNGKEPKEGEKGRVGARSPQGEEGEEEGPLRFGPSLPATGLASLRR